MSAVADRPLALVVDDDPVVLMIASDYIDDLGFEVISATSADEAFAVLERCNDIRLIFTDVHMPGSMDGVALASAVRSRWPLIQILVASGHPLPQPETLPIGAMFLQKPYRQIDVDGMIHEMFS